MTPIFDEMPGEVRYASDVIAIWKLQSAYQHYLLGYAVAEIISLFADSDEVEIELSNKGAFTGKSAARRCFTRNLAHLDVPGVLNFHMSLNPVIEVDRTGTRAKGVWLSPGISTFPMKGELMGGWNYGKYDMEYVKEGPAWKILKFRYVQIFLTPYADGWVKNSIDPNFDGFSNERPDRASNPDYYRPYSADEAKAFGPLPPKPFEA